MIPFPGLKKLPYDERIRQLGLWTLEEKKTELICCKFSRCRLQRTIFN